MDEVVGKGKLTIKQLLGPLQQLINWEIRSLQANHLSEAEHCGSILDPG